MQTLRASRGSCHAQYAYRSEPIRPQALAHLCAFSRGELIKPTMSLGWFKIFMHCRLRALHHCLRASRKTTLKFACQAMLWFRGNTVAVLLVGYCRCKL